MRRSKILEILTSRDGQPQGPSRQDGSINMMRRRRHLVKLYLVATLLLGMMFTVYVWQSTKMVETKIRLQSLEKQISILETNNDVLKAEISKLQSLSRIEKVARTELGMVIPQKLCYIPVDETFLKK